ncbi:YoaK family protein [Streptomyces sp. NPDC090022]|uniref:YoaK family protein n=1 Tax=Streptomyces sp. NPDC090022 TaxID=3365920 RepID=UPI0037F2C642
MREPGHPLTLSMVVLTASTGLIEAVSLLALGPVFTAMQTGNVLFLSFGAAGARGLPALCPAVSLLAFAVGAVCGARAEARYAARGRRWVVLGLLGEAVLIAGAAAVGWGLTARFGSPTPRHLAVTALLAFAMGLRNVTAMRVGVPGVPTTLVTRTLTALLGSSLGHDATFGHGAAAWGPRAAALLAMFAGGLTGALLVGAGWTVNWLLVPPLALVLLVAAVRLAYPALGPRPT